MGNLGICSLAEQLYSCVKVYTEYRIVQIGLTKNVKNTNSNQNLLANRNLSVVQWSTTTEEQNYRKNQKSQIDSPKARIKVNTDIQDLLTIALPFITE